MFWMDGKKDMEGFGGCVPLVGKEACVFHPCRMVLPIRRGARFRVTDTRGHLHSVQISPLWLGEEKELLTFNKAYVFVSKGYPAWTGQGQYVERLCAFIITLDPVYSAVGHSLHPS
jgi:hypothetical protein